MTTGFDSGYYQSEILRPMGIEPFLDKILIWLSWGELQRVAMTACLSREADLYLLDEPSAHLDVEERMFAAKVIGGLPSPLRRPSGGGSRHLSQ